MRDGFRKPLQVGDFVVLSDRWTFEIGLIETGHPTDAIKIRYPMISSKCLSGGHYEFPNAEWSKRGRYIQPVYKYKLALGQKNTYRAVHVIRYDFVGEDDLPVFLNTSYNTDPICNQLEMPWTEVNRQAKLLLLQHREKILAKQ